jgi:parallel beta-helix repeat protein
VVPVLADKPVGATQKNLQALIDSAKPGDTVIVPKGIYKEPIDINKSLTLKGELRGECVFEITADRPAVFIDTKGKGKVTVQDLTIKWQLATSNKGIERPFALGVKDTKAEIKNCSFLPLGNFQRSPVAVRVDGFSEATISRSRFEGFEYVICYGQGTKGKTTDCLIMDCGHQGIINYSGATLHVERNVITGSRFHAVRCTGGTLHVKDNLLINNANRGIYLGNRSGSGTITNNLIVNNAVGIGAFARARYEIKNNVVADSSYSGIGMYKSCYLTIRDNIFSNNERGWVMFDRGEKGGNTSYRNTFWKNKVDDENFKKTGNSINADPGFIDPENGDFSLKPGPALENKQGLTNPQLFKDLWKVWKNRKDKKVPFTK